MENTVGNIAGLFAAVSDAVIGAENGRIVFANPAAEKLLWAGLAGAETGRVLPESVLGSGAGAVLTSAELCGRSVVISTARFGELDIFYISETEKCETAGLGECAEYTLRTLLANMKLATDRLRSYLEEAGSERSRAEGAVLDHNCHQIRRLLMNTVAEDAMARGTMPSMPERTDMAVLCGDVVSTASHFAAPRGIEMSFECRTEDRVVTIDRDLAEQMLLDLVLNSLLRLGTGGSIAVTLAGMGDKLVLSVDDTGRVIRGAELSSLFDGPHFRTGMGSMGRGDGMGLSLARSIAEFSGGSLLIESTAEKTSARVMLPVDRSDSTDLREPAAAYRVSGMDPVLTQLSPWLRSSDYDMKYTD